MFYQSNYGEPVNFIKESMESMLVIVSRIWLYVRIGVLVFSDVYKLLPIKPIRLLVDTITALLQCSSPNELLGKVSGDEGLNSLLRLKAIIYCTIEDWGWWEGPFATAEV